MTELISGLTHSHCTARLLARLCPLQTVCTVNARIPKAIEELSKTTHGRTSIIFLKVEYLPVFLRQQNLTFEEPEVVFTESKRSSKIYSFRFMHMGEQAQSITV